MAVNSRSFVVLHTKLGRDASFRPRDNVRRARCEIRADGGLYKTHGAYAPRLVKLDLSGGPEGLSALTRPVVRGVQSFLEAERVPMPADGVISGPSADGS